MLQIGPHYVDVMEMLMGPIREVSGMLSQLVLPGDNPDVAGLVMKHENGAISTLNAGYASAGENYVMNIYGKNEEGVYPNSFYGILTIIKNISKFFEN